jgi:hypothetical protein
MFGNALPCQFHFCVPASWVISPAYVFPFICTWICVFCALHLFLRVCVVRGTVYNLHFHCINLVYLRVVSIIFMQAPIALSTIDIERLTVMCVCHEGCKVFMLVLPRVTASLMILKLCCCHEQRPWMLLPLPPPPDNHCPVLHDMYFRFSDCSHFNDELPAKSIKTYL